MTHQTLDSSAHSAYGYTPPKPLSPRELIDTFGDSSEIKEMVQRNLKELEPGIRKYRDFRKEITNIINAYPETSPYRDLCMRLNVIAAKYGGKFPVPESPRTTFRQLMDHLLYTQDDEFKKNVKNYKKLKQCLDILNRTVQIPQGETAEELKSKIDTADYIGRDTELKQRGNRFMGCCPLPDHNERTPSFVVYEGDRGFYCYGCHRGGSVIDYVMHRDNVSFVEALNSLRQET